MPAGRGPRGPGDGGERAGWRMGRMPVLEPNPQNGQKKLLAVLGVMLAVTIVIGVIASIASP